MIELDEHADVLPAWSVAVAWNVVEESSVTVTGRPTDAKPSAGPVAAIAPEHNASVYNLTVEPAAAVPLTFGVLLLAGESGSVSVNVGAAVGAESTT